MRNTTENERALRAALLTLLAEIHGGVGLTHYGSELSKAIKQAEKTLAKQELRRERPERVFVDFQNVTIGMNGTSEKDCYKKLCEALHSIGGEWTTETYIDRKGNVKSTRKLWARG